MKNFKSIEMNLIVLTALITLPLTIVSADEGEEVAVPAVTDLQGVAIVQTGPIESLSKQPYGSELKLLDLNQDLKLNDFDIKQFQSIVETLDAEASTGLELASRFRFAQKNQYESFPTLYDLDRDGLFSEQDVDSFTKIVNAFDQGAATGKEITHLFRLRVYPEEREE